jgi:hypothetical protein
MHEMAWKKHEPIQKQAMLSAVFKGVRALGSWASRNKGKALGAGATAAFAPMDIADAAKRVNTAKQVGKAQGNLSKTFKVGPTY